MLPTFLGIGVPRAGTTWLNDLLDSHPQILMAQGRKEVRFFTDNYERGLGWYESFFPAAAGAPRAIGEFTPDYLADPACPARVASVPSVTKLILSVRDPIDRLVSNYRGRQRVDHFRGSLEDFVVDYPQIVDRGRYATHLERWLQHFDRDQFLVLTFEGAVADVERTTARLSEFLGVDPFPPGAGAKPKNQAFSPRQPRLYATAQRAARFLLRHDIDWGYRIGARFTGGRFRQPEVLPPVEVSPALRSRLVELYRPEAERLAAITGISIATWPTVASAE